AGHLVALPVTRLYGWTHLGLHIVPRHKCRVTVYYDNPTGHSLPMQGWAWSAVSSSPTAGGNGRGPSAATLSIRWTSGTTCGSPGDTRWRWPAAADPLSG